MREESGGTLEEVSCNLCGAGGGELLFSKGRHGVRRCGGCGLVYVSPRPAAETLSREVYGEEYFDAGKGYGIEGHFGDANAAKTVALAHRRLEMLERHVGRGVLMDVGCAGGHFMRAAIGRGWRAEGAEISEYAASRAAKEHGLDVRAGDFCELAAEPGKYDLITMLDSIEHMPDPACALRNAFVSLRAGGVLYVITPNYDGLPARVLGENWGLIEPEHHLYYFTPDTLGRMLGGAGFEPVEWRYPLLGLNDLLSSAGALKSVGVPVGDSHKSFVRKYLRAPRDFVRSALNALDEAVFAPLFAKGRGVNMEVVARKPG